MNILRCLISIICLISLANLGFAADSHDRHADITWHHNSVGYNFDWLMEGVVLKGAQQIEFASGTNWKIVACEDFDRNGHSDLLWRDSSSGQNAVWLMWANTVLSYNMIQAGDINYYVVGTGDFDSDGYADILWRHTSLDLTYVWKMGGPNGIDYQTAYQVTPGQSNPDWIASATGDFNLDGNTDIVWRSSSTGYVDIWFMNGITRQSATTIQLSPGSDFDLAST